MLCLHHFVLFVHASGCTLHLLAMDVNIEKKKNDRDSNHTKHK